jgi:CubicO group peptidase (beta-lactamase class C family)
MKKAGNIFKKVFKWLFIVLGIVLLLANVFILVTGRFYLYRAVGYTYLVGQSGPGIHDKDYFYSREIAHAQPEPWPYHREFGKVNLSGEEIKALEKYKTTSFLVFHEDSLLLEHYFEDFTPETVSNSFSMAKSVVSIAVGIAIAEGKIKSVDQPVSDFIPEYKEGKRSELTIFHLLTMSAALDWNESGGNPLSHNAEAYYGTDLEEMILECEVIGEPGKIFNYQSGATMILGYVVEKATGMKLSKYIEEKIWKKIGAENTAYWSLDHEDGTEKAYCCMYSTGRDFARFGKLYMHHGNWNGTQIVPEEWVKTSLTPAPLMDEDGKPNERYGYCWWMVKHKDMPCFYMRGILGQYVICIPEKELIIVRTGHKRGEKQGDQPLDIFTYMNIAERLIE